MDADAAWECVRAFDDPACVIVKHANPCGVAESDDIYSAYDLAFKPIQHQHLVESLH